MKIDVRYSSFRFARLRERLMEQIHDDSGLMRWKLRRSNSVPIHFTGDRVANAEGMDKDGIRKYNIWILTDGLAWAWGVAWSTNFKGEVPFAWAGVCDGPLGVANSLLSLNPIPPRAGFPDGEKYAKKQEKYIQDYTNIYLATVASALEEAGIAFEQPYCEDFSSVDWRSIESIPDIGRECVIRIESGAVLNAVLVESKRCGGQYAWDVGTKLAYDAAVEWGYV